MRKYMFFIALISLVLAMLACNLGFRPIVERNARATQRAIDLATFEALYGTLPPTEPFDPLGSIGNRWCGLVNCDTVTPSPPITVTPATPAVATQVPSAREVVINGQGKEWVWYYPNSSLLASEQLRVLRAGTIWYGLPSSDSAIQFVLQGWVPESDIVVTGIEIQVKSCTAIEHPWDHLSGKIECHTHIWGEGAYLRGQVLPDTRGNIASAEATSRQYRDTVTGKLVFGPGWSVVFEQESWIPAENGDL